MSNRIKLAALALFATAVCMSCQKDITYYTVTFDGNGGQVYGEAVVTVAEGNKVPDPGYTTPPEGYAQTGWFKEAELINAWDFHNDVVTGDMTLYAGWGRVYTVTFDANGGTLYGEAVITVAEGDKVPEPEDTTPPEGYAQKGWYKEVEMINAWDFHNDVVTADMTLYAGWGRACTVTFDGNGGQVYGEMVVTVAEGERVPYLAGYTTPPEGYVQKGWYKEAEVINVWDFHNDVVTADMTLYAGWKRLYTITYHANGGTFPYDGGEVRTEQRISGEQLMLPGNVIKPGYVLEGWYKDAELTERWDFLSDVVTGDGALYAKWDAGIEGLTLENYPRVDGATSTRALNNMIACKLLGIPYVWSWLSKTHEFNVWPKGDFGSGDPTLFEGHIATSQTHGAMLNLIDGKADIVLRSTTASPDEKAAAQDAGVTLIETPIALDAFVFLKHSLNPVQSLTLEQIRKIYTKQITNWSEVGGNDAPMTVYTRPRNSGSEEALRELVMKDLEPAEFPEEQQVMSMFGLFWAMENQVNGIGYIFKNYKEMIVRRHDSTFAIDGIFPDATTMKDRTYPLTTEVYAIIRADLDPDSMGYKLYEWLQTDAAKVVLEECGFLPYREG